MRKKTHPGYDVPSKLPSFKVPTRPSVLKFTRKTSKRLSEIRNQTHSEFQDHGSEAIDAGLLAAYELGREEMRAKCWELALQNWNAIPDPAVYVVPWPSNTDAGLGRFKSNGVSEIYTKRVGKKF